MTVQTGASRCKMAGAGFHSIANLRAQSHNAVLVDRGVFQADCHRENCRTACAEMVDFLCSSQVKNHFLI
jgi:hypothetical protein